MGAEKGTEEVGGEPSAKEFGLEAVCCQLSFSASSQMLEIGKSNSKLDQKALEMDERNGMKEAQKSKIWVK